MHWVLANWGNTPARANGELVQILSLLVEKGADVNAASSRYGFTPLHFAECLLNEDERDAATQFLKNNNANENARCNMEGFIYDVKTPHELGQMWLNELGQMWLGQMWLVSSQYWT